MKKGSFLEVLDIIILDNFSRLREEYMNYVESYIHNDDDESSSDVPHHKFLTSFLNHCLPHLDPDTDPALCHLITSLVSHVPVFDVQDLDQDDMRSQVSRYSTDTRYESDMCECISCKIVSISVISSLTIYCQFQV